MAPFKISSDLVGRDRYPDDSKLLSEVIQKLIASEEFTDLESKLMWTHLRGYIVTCVVVLALMLAMLSILIFYGFRIHVRTKNLKLAHGLTRYKHEQYLLGILQTIQGLKNLLAPYIKKTSDEKGEYLEIGLQGFEESTVHANGDITVERTRTVQVEREVQIDEADIGNGRLCRSIVDTPDRALV